VMQLSLLVSKAQVNASFNVDPNCQITADIGGGCKDDCTPGEQSVFDLSNAAQFVGLTNSCACALGPGTTPTTGGMVSDVPNQCPNEQKCIQHICDNNHEHDFMFLGWFPRLHGFPIPSWIEKYHVPAAPAECDPNSYPAQDPTDCTDEIITDCLDHIPDACQCQHRDLRCLMEENIWHGRCQSHVEFTVNCKTTPTSDTRVNAVRTILRSLDFQSIPPSNSAGTSTVDQIYLAYWLPVVAILVIGLLTSWFYIYNQRQQYKARINQMNLERESGRMTGLSVFDGAEALKNPALQQQVASDNVDVVLTTQ